MREIRVLLIGRTGHGKSSVGNTMLGRDHFEVSHSSTSCTKTCNYGEAERGRIRLVVTEPPGIFDTATSRLDLMMELIKALVYTTPGFHVIAFVLRPDRFTPELQDTQRLFFEWFGGNVRDYACLILTHSSSDADISRFTRNPHQSLHELVQGCGGVDSILPFENTVTPDIKETQVQRFLDHVIEIQRRNGGQYFTNLAFNISKAYADNRDLDTITNDSLLCLQKAGQQFFRDSMNSLKLVKEPRPRVGNVKIFYDSDPDGGRTDPGPAETDVAADITMSDEVLETRLYPSSRRNRVLVNKDDDTSPIRDSASSQLPSGYTGANQSPGGYAAADQSTPSQNRSQMAGGRSSHQPSVMPPVHANDPPSTGSGSGSDQSGGSEDYTNHRKRMNNEENVNMFIRVLQDIGEKIRQLWLKIKSNFT